jgi:hypothetical protein
MSDERPAADGRVISYLREHASADAKKIRRFAEKVEVLENGCWKWTGANNARGPRGQFWVGTRGQVAYRWAWQAVHGPVPEGLELDHYRFPDDCVGPLCAHPDHVEPVRHRDNVLRGRSPAARNARKTACLNGHPFDRLDSRGRRQCSICARARDREWYQRRRDADPPAAIPGPGPDSGRPADRSPKE